MSDLNAFEEIAENLDHTPLWRVVWEESETDLKANGVDEAFGEDIGRIAWERLTQEEQRQARDELFYVYWQAAVHDEREKARQPVKAELTARLAAFRECRDHGAPFPAGLLDDIARLADILHGGAA